MEHSDVRKKLNDYSKGFITNKTEETEIEAHIKKCELCRRELAMWQDVNDRQHGLDGGRVSSRLAEKAQQISGEMEKDVNMAPGAKRMGYVANTLKSPVAMIVWTITCVIFGLAIMLMFVKDNVSPWFHLFMIAGGIAMIFVAIKTSVFNKKKK